MPRPRRTPLWASAALALSLTLAGCGGSDEAAETTPAPAPTASTPFDYDASRPLAVRDAGRANKNYPVVLRDISFATPGGRVQGFLALPPGKPRRPGVVYVHGSGGDRGQLLVQAMWLAGRGSVTLAFTAPSSTAAQGTSQGLTPVQGLRRQRISPSATSSPCGAPSTCSGAGPSRSVTARLRRLERGCQDGGAAGRRRTADRRVRPHVGRAAPVSVYASQAPVALRDDVAASSAPSTPSETIARARPGSLLLQDGRQDAVVPRAALEDLAAATPDGTDIRWYDAGHELDTKAYRDQLDWLARKLAIHGRVRGALTGP